MEFFKSGNNRKFFLKDFRNAEHYKPDIAPPRQQFQGYVNFIINRRLISMMEDTSSFRTRISSLVRTATLPEVTFATETKNSFNRKKIIQIGVDHSPISMTVMDTVQNEWLTLFMKYYSYHYMNPRNKFDGESRDTSFMGGDTHGGYQAGNFGLQGETNGKGYQWSSNDFGLDLGVTKNFFERIDLILYHGDKGVQYSMFNPMMKGFSGSSLDYSSSELMDFKIDFEYENFTTTNVYNFSLGEQDLARFENMAGAKLPGMGTIKKPVALDTTNVSILNGKDGDGRSRTQQPKTGGKETGVDSYMNTDKMFDDSSILVSELEEGTKTNKIYTPVKKAKDSGKTGFDGFNSWLEESPFGRIVDKGLSAVINGQDTSDILKQALTDEINYAITNDSDDRDIFNNVEPGSESDKQNEAGESNETTETNNSDGDSNSPYINISF
jgi:hypothetical protein